MQQTLPEPFYYLDNFQRALDWIVERHAHLLSGQEQAFSAGFSSLPKEARALLVRMVMRKGSLFRATKLRYPEIGPAERAAAPLIDIGWVDPRAPLTLDELFALLTKAELATVFGLSPSVAARPKAELLEALRAGREQEHCFSEWWPGSGDHVYQVVVDPLCERLRLLFFGNGWQDWSEFVLAELGIYRYEKVELGAQAFGFRTRSDVDLYLQLQQCRERLEAGEATVHVLAEIPEPISDNPWLEARRAKLLFTLGQQLEREGELAQALEVYERCTHSGARVRRIRVLEQSEQLEEAWQLADKAQAEPENEAERQQLSRILPRLRRKLGLPKMPAATTQPIPRMDIVLAPPGEEISVEQAAAAHFTRPGAPVYYVENTLFNSLFGLLCWNAVFAPVPGAFFHPFHAGPADLYRPDFVARRAEIFASCLAQLDNETYRETIRQTYAAKFGIVSPFVFWDVLDEALVDLALACIPAAHLKACFERMLFDLKTNCSGLPDLIQFHPDRSSYRLIEVKGPGDRLQDNQVRWLDHFTAHDIPVTVCYVQWAEDL